MYDVAPPTITPPKRRLRWLRRPLTIILLVCVVVAVAVGGGVIYMNHWYTEALKPLSQQESRVRVTIPKGADVSQIGDLLEQKKVIKSARAFGRYVANSHNKNNLQAGTYAFSPSYSVQKIVGMLANGEVDSFNLTLTPGKRLDQIVASLTKAGFEKSQLDAALGKQYNHPLFAGKPATADLEGYIFPDTYHLDAETTSEKLLTTTFDTFWQQIQKEGLVEKLQAQGLNLYQGITLASIVQQEVTDYEDQQMVAQVFERRLKENMPLGADPTFRYASKKAGVPDAINIDSPYNTRRYKGLPPGPIGNFNIAALRAVANPSATDFLYFVAGDDGVTRFSKTQAEHEALTKQYCVELCKQ